MKAFERRLYEAQKEMGKPLIEFVPVIYESEKLVWSIVRAVPMLILVGLAFMAIRTQFSRGGVSTSIIVLLVLSGSQYL